MKQRKHMSDRTATVSWKGYVDARLRAQSKALSLAQKILDHRLEGMNEFRADLRHQATQFMTRTEFGIFQDRVMEDIRSLRESRATAEGKASQISVNITFLIAVFGLIIGTIGLLLR